MPSSSNISFREWVPHIALEVAFLLSLKKCGTHSPAFWTFPFHTMVDWSEVLSINGTQWLNSNKSMYMSEIILDTSFPFAQELHNLQTSSKTITLKQLWHAPNNWFPSHRNQKRINLTFIKGFGNVKTKIFKYCIWVMPVSRKHFIFQLPTC